MMYLLYKTITRATIPPFPILPRDVDPSDDVVDNHDISAIIVATVVPTTIISTLFAFARMYVKGWIQRRIQYDDGILLAAVVAGWTATGTTLKAVALGNGKHVGMLTDEQKEETLRWTIFSFGFGIIALALPKLAVVALMNRLLNPRRLHRLFLWTLGLLCCVGLLGNVIGLFAECPQEAVVNITYTKTACLGPERAVAYSISTSGISAATNAYLAIYVALSVRRLKIARRKRLAITISLVLGLLALFTALFKCTRLKSLGSPDFTYDSADLVIWTSLEADVVIIAACIPALQPLVDHLFPGHFSTPMPSPTIPASPTSTASRRKLWPGPTCGDLEAARDFSLSPQGLEMIMIEKEFEIAYSRTTVKRSCTSDTWVSELPDEEKFRIVKDHGPDGSITTTVVVRSATRPPDHPAFPPQ
ncbi:uncharacterized protein CCOS01_13050 [Colletotrichum costaricense]|uniref:Rhodopsin domain-containing protein n=1 Tax=Colletotrichum costaricense TaxID=1209916 RepID=A0AAJ0DW43_9PEZI|nr:uncharacterized protein CCOS01_13050 [Colletotrichum costaricense]KAK1515852.1 hypothetical protein CCOS01_13050 [Colletotrichum costaricense]